MLGSQSGTLPCVAAGIVRVLAGYIFNGPAKAWRRDGKAHNGALPQARCPNVSKGPGSEISRQRLRNTFARGFEGVVFAEHAESSVQGKKAMTVNRCQ